MQVNKVLLFFKSTPPFFMHCMHPTGSRRFIWKNTLLSFLISLFLIQLAYKTLKNRGGGKEKFIYLAINPLA